MPWKKTGGLTAQPWANILEPGVQDGARVPCIGPNGKLIIIEYNSATGWLPVKPTNSDYLGVSQDPRPLGSYVPMSTRSYLVPGGLMAMGTRNTTTAYTHRYRPAGPNNQQYLRVRIGWRVQSNQTCTLDRMYLSSAGAAVNAITENTASGWMTAIGSPVTIEPGSNLMFGSVQWLGEWDVNVNALGDLYISAQASGAAIPTIAHGGGANSRVSIGWVRTGQEFMTNLLTSGTFAPRTGSESFSTGFPFVIEFIGLQTPVCNLGFFGDSHTWGYGDDNQPSRPAGISNRLNIAWQTANSKVAAINLARVGATTAQINEALGVFLEELPHVKVVALQQGSVNNYSNSLPDAQQQSDWLEAENIIYGYGRRVIGHSAFFGAANPTRWAVHQAHWDWCHARLGVRSVQTTRNAIVNETNGTFQSGFAFVDNGHGNTLAYDTWGTSALAPFNEALADIGAVIN